MPTNYCQKLSDQVAKMKQARQKCADSLGRVLKSEDAMILEEFRRDLAGLEAEIALMGAEWEKNLVTLPNGMRLFRQEYETLMLVIDRDRLGEEEIFRFMQVSENNSLIRLWMPWKINKEIHNFNTYKYFPSLQDLRLGGGTEIFDTRGIRNLSRLKAVEFSRIVTENLPELIDSVGRLTGLEELHMPITEDVVDITKLAGLVNLRLLNIKGTGVRDISAVGTMTKLEELRLSRYVTDLSPIRNLTFLRKLSIHGEASDLSPIEDLLNLEELWIEETESDLSVLESLPKLRIVSMRENTSENIRVANNLRSRGVVVNS